MARWNELIKFLHSISRTQLGEKEAKLIFHFSQRQFPWESVGALAEMDGIGGLLYRHLKDLGLLDKLPESFTRQVENSYRKTRERTIAVIAEAKALSKRFEQVGIPVVALQGLSLLSVYGDPGLRPLSDVDLMVKRAYKEPLKALLAEAGYDNLIVTYPDLFYKDGIRIDIHTHVLNLDRIETRSYLFPEDLTAMWERVMPFSGESDGLLLLDPCDNFIALAAHALKHSYSRLIWLADLHESLLLWVTKPNGWELMADRARFWQQERVILYALVLMERIFDLKVPFWVKSELGIQRLNIVENHLIRLKLRGLSTNELCIVLWLCNIKGIGKKMKFIGETIFPASEVMAQIFPRSPVDTKGSVYAKRIAGAITVLMRDLHHAVIFSFRSGWHR